MLIGIISIILSLSKMIVGYITSLFILLLESVFFAIPLYYTYVMVRGNFDLPVLEYNDVLLILLGLKILKFSSFDMAKIASEISQENILNTNKADN